ncbi:MAG: FKBP-type peptidyl-prolyl cis-trans isomerase [Fimbriimonas sp.]
MMIVSILAATAVLFPAPVVQAKTLQIKDLKVGTGPGATDGDYLTMDYKGTLTNGTQFDASTGGAPFKFMLGASMVIKGWDKGVLGMKVGGTRKLVIPAELGYGAQATGSIPANSTLVFEITLRKIERATFTVLKPGKGPSAAFGDSLLVHYKGSLKDGGKQFDSSYERGQPFPVDLPGRVIPGFTQGLLGIKQGEKRRVTIPASLGYGERGAGGVIPPNADLIFELEAVQVTKGAGR